MAIRAYFRSYDGHGYMNTDKFEDMSWTGRWKTVKTDGIAIVYIERRIMFAGIIPLWTEWVDDKDILFRDVEETVNEC